MTKRGIAFSGGGSRGQFHVGVAKKLIGEERGMYDCYAGVSVGALVAACLAQYKAGEELEAYSHLDNVFSRVHSKDIWKRWFPFGKASVWKTSLLDSSPLAKLTRAEFQPQMARDSGKELRVGTVSLNRLKNQTFSQNDAEITDAIIASSAMPVFFTPVEMRGEWWTDGGIRETTPIKACLEAGCDEIDVVICQPEAQPLKGKPSLMQIVGRAVESMSDEIVWRDYKMALLYNKIAKLDGSKKYVKFRLFSPVSPLNGDALKFDPAEAAMLQAEGYKVACDVLKG